MLNLDNFTINSDEVTLAFNKDVNSFCKEKSINLTQFFEKLDTMDDALELIGKYNLLKKILVIKPENHTDYVSCYSYIIECMVI